MKKYLLLLLPFAACSKDKDSSKKTIAEKVQGKSWRCYEFTHNGTINPTISSQQHTYEFRTDGKIYYSQISPVYKDTLQYQILNDQKIKITKPWVSNAVVINLKIDFLHENHFDFTLTSNENADVDKYKTQAQ